MRCAGHFSIIAIRFFTDAKIIFPTDLVDIEQLKQIGPRVFGVRIRARRLGHGGAGRRGGRLRFR